MENLILPALARSLEKEKKKKKKTLGIPKRISIHVTLAFFSLILPSFWLMRPEQLGLLTKYVINTKVFLLVFSLTRRDSKAQLGDLFHKRK